MIKYGDNLENQPLGNYGRVFPLEPSMGGSPFEVGMWPPLALLVWVRGVGDLCHQKEKKFILTICLSVLYAYAILIMIGRTVIMNGCLVDML